MHTLRKVVLFALLAFCGVTSAIAQDLGPRACIVTPLRSNVVTLTWSYYSGPLNSSGAVPIEGATGTYHVSVFSYYHSLNFFGGQQSLLLAVTLAVNHEQCPSVDRRMVGETAVKYLEHTG